MSTAIVRTYCPEGFVVAADGRVAGADDGEVVSDEAQKIFPIGGTTPSIACSLSGTTVIASSDRPEAPEIVLDFTKEILRMTQTISIQRAITLDQYAAKCCYPIRQKLEEAKHAGRIKFPETAVSDPGESGTTICKIFMDGYFKRAPVSVKIRFFHQDQVSDLEIVSQPLFPGATWKQGSTVVTDLVDQGDRRFSKYEDESALLFGDCPNEELRIYAQMAHCYINICRGPEARALDPLACAGIGGHIQVAIITARDGFKWLLPPATAATPVER